MNIRNFFLKTTEVGIRRDGWLSSRLFLHGAAILFYYMFWMVRKECERNECFVGYMPRCRVHAVKMTSIRTTTMTTVLIRMTGRWKVSSGNSSRRFGFGPFPIHPVLQYVIFSSNKKTTTIIVNPVSAQLGSFRKVVSFWLSSFCPTEW